MVETLAQLAYHQTLVLGGVVRELRRVHGVGIEGLSQRCQRAHATAEKGLVQPPQVHSHALGHGGDETDGDATGQAAWPEADRLVVTSLQPVAQVQQVQEQFLLRN